MNRHRALFIFLSLLLPTLLQAQMPGGHIKRPEKKTHTTQNSGNSASVHKMTLYDLLIRPMGLVFDVKTAPYSTVRSKLFSKYRVFDDDEGGGRHDFWVTTEDNVQCRKMRYNGFSFETFYYRIDPSGEQEVRFLSYRFKIKESVLPDTAPPYNHLDKVVSDFHKMGINISYEKDDAANATDTYSRNAAEGTYKTDNMKYKIKLSHGWPDVWILDIDLWIHK